MCGIARLIDFNGDFKERRSIISKMVKTLERRGPDSEGVYESQYVVFGHRRLVVVDPDGGKQPMSKAVGDRKYTVVYNGELYNIEKIGRACIIA